MVPHGPPWSQATVHGLQTLNLGFAKTAQNQIGIKLEYSNEIPIQIGIYLEYSKKIPIR